VANAVGHSLSYHLHNPFQWAHNTSEEINGLAEVRIDYAVTAILSPLYGLSHQESFKSAFPVDEGGYFS
jgi:hypothetical protein